MLMALHFVWAIPWSTFRFFIGIRSNLLEFAKIHNHYRRRGLRTAHHQQPLPTTIAAAINNSWQDLRGSTTPLPVFAKNICVTTQVVRQTTSASSYTQLQPHHPHHPNDISSHTSHNVWHAQQRLDNTAFATVLYSSQNVTNCPPAPSPIQQFLCYINNILDHAVDMQILNIPLRCIHQWHPRMTLKV